MAADLGLAFVGSDRLTRIWARPCFTAYLRHHRVLFAPNDADLDALRVALGCSLAELLNVPTLFSMELFVLQNVMAPPLSLTCGAALGAFSRDPGALFLSFI